MFTSHRIELFVDNYVGVLDRILILVRRSGWNVKDLHVCEEQANNGTRIQFIIEGKADLSLLRTQLSRLDCIQTQCIDRLPGAHRELALAASADRDILASLAAEWGAKLVSSAEGEDIYEYVGTAHEVDAFLLAVTGKVQARTTRSGAIDL